jgi:hypothetical protein
MGIRHAIQGSPDTWAERVLAKTETKSSFQNDWNRRFFYNQELANSIQNTNCVYRVIFKVRRLEGRERPASAQ